MTALEHKSPAELALSIGAMVKAHQVTGLDVSAGVDEYLAVLLQRPCGSAADALALVTFARRITERMVELAPDEDRAALPTVAAVLCAYLDKVMAHLEDVTGIAHEAFLPGDEPSVMN